MKRNKVYYKEQRNSYIIKRVETTNWKIARKRQKIKLYVPQPSYKKKKKKKKLRQFATNLSR